MSGYAALTRPTETAGTTSYAYNTLGQLTEEIRSNSGSPSAATTYGYNSTSADLESITYPSGLVVTYQRDTNGRIEAIFADGENVLRNVKYMPFGPVGDVVLGNNILTLDRTYNNRYLVERIKVGNMDYQYQYYADGNVSSINGVIPPTLAGGSTSYTLNPGTNQTDAATGQYPAEYSYDSHGNITADGVRTFIYNQDNRLVEVKEGETVIADYVYDGYGRRVKKVSGGVTTFFHYDRDNNLIAEADGAGNPLRDYIYLGGEPVAMKLYGTQAGLYFFLNDHLGTPQKIVDSAGSLVWQAAYLPFGKAQVNYEIITNNLRFPGQYYDAETDHHYNWHRYYDPSTGRYLTPDPIGLAGGINPFTYVQGNPINWTDPWGLDRLINPRPGGPNGPTITFINDVPGGASPNLPVSDSTAEMIEQAVIDTGADININSTTGGTHDPKSRHPFGMGCDIDTVDGKPATSTNPSAKNLQESFNNQPNIRENYGPYLNTKTDSSGVLHQKPWVAPSHKSHIHVTGQR